MFLTKSLKKLYLNFTSYKYFRGLKFVSSQVWNRSLLSISGFMHTSFYLPFLLEIRFHSFSSILIHSSTQHFWMSEMRTCLPVPISAIMLYFGHTAIIPHLLIDLFQLSCWEPIVSIVWSHFHPPPQLFFHRPNLGPPPSYFFDPTLTTPPPPNCRSIFPM